jgi:hypothetical protein
MTAIPRDSGDTFATFASFAVKKVLLFPIRAHPRSSAVSFCFPIWKLLICS